MLFNVEQIAVTGLDDNFSYIVHDDTSKHCFIVDPSGDIEKVCALISDQSLTVAGILLTHTHHDHYDKLDDVLQEYGIELPVYVHTIGAEKFSAQNTIALEEGSEVMLGSATIQVMHTPGHIADAVCFYIDTENTADGIPKVITGDTLFVEGCGRTDAEGVRPLYESLQKLKTLPENTEVYPGHNYGSKPHSTIAHEKAHNRFLLAENFEAFQDLRLPKT